MSDSIPIDEVASRTGLTARALRFYEARGLISPLRSQSGRRWFGPAELQRIHQIVALKKAGLSLGDIKRLFDRKPINLKALLIAQKTRLAQQADEIAEAISLVDIALSRIDRGEPLDAATLCSLIRDGEKVMTDETNAWKAVIDRYYTAEEQAEWRDRMAAAPEFLTEGYIEKWGNLSSRIEAALPLDPAGEEALAFVREWFELLRPFSQNATKSMWEGSSRMYSEVDRWNSEVDPGLSKRVWDFITLAAAAARNSGKDIGPLPAFMDNGS